MDDMRNEDIVLNNSATASFLKDLFMPPEKVLDDRFEYESMRREETDGSTVYYFPNLEIGIN